MNSNYQYNLTINDLNSRCFKVTISFLVDQKKELTFFVPFWGPGHCGPQFFGKNVRKFQVFNQKGQMQIFRPLGLGRWKVEFASAGEYEVHYEILALGESAFEAYIDEYRAHVFGSAVFMGVLEEKIIKPKLRVIFPPLWSKISTSLQDIAPRRELFLYEANDYDHLVDTPLFLGCHETDGFLLEGASHELAYSRLPREREYTWKTHIKELCEQAHKLFGSFPFSRYTAYFHFLPKLNSGYGGGSSCFVYGDSRKVLEAEGYSELLILWTRQYLRAWLGKCVCPLEHSTGAVGWAAPFPLLWLEEGLTGFLAELIVLRAGLVQPHGFLSRLVRRVNQYRQTPGRLFESLEESSLKAFERGGDGGWQTVNQSVSCQLKGFLVFFLLCGELYHGHSSFDEFVRSLWDSYLKGENKGFKLVEVLAILQEFCDREIVEKFEEWVTIPGDLNFSRGFQAYGLRVEKERASCGYLGVQFLLSSPFLMVQQVLLDGAAYKGGLFKGDQVLEVDGRKVNKASFAQWIRDLDPGQRLHFKVLRQGRVLELVFLAGQSPELITSLTLEKKDLFDRALGLGR